MSFTSVTFASGQKLTAAKLTQLVTDINTALTAGIGGQLLIGSGIPESGTGNNGDMWLDYSGHALYGPKASGAWGDGTSLIGPAGATGANGAAGNTLLSGSGAPSTGTGVDGSFFIDVTNWVIYGPKLAGAWGTGQSLVGPSGAGSGDMLKSTYDTNADGIVDHASVADVTPWSGITSKPTAFTPSAHVASHRAGGTDALAIGDILAFPADATTFLNGTGAFSVPPGGNGATIWYGTSDPTTVSGAANSDWYLNTSAGTFWQLHSGTWALIYTPARSGEKIFYGASDPTTVAGALVQDWYLNTASGKFFQYQGSTPTWTLVYTTVTPTSLGALIEGATTQPTLDDDDYLPVVFPASPLEKVTVAQLKSFLALTFTEIGNWQTGYGTPTYTPSQIPSFYFDYGSGILYEFHGDTPVWAQCFQAMSGHQGWYFGTDDPTGIPSGSYTDVDCYLNVTNGKIWQLQGTTPAWVLVYTPAGGGSGTVTSVTSANADIAVSASSPAPVLTLNSGTSANQIVKVGSDGYLPALDGRRLINLPGGGYNATFTESNLTSGVLTVTHPLGIQFPAVFLYDNAGQSALVSSGMVTGVDTATFTVDLRSFRVPDAYIKLLLHNDDGSGSYAFTDASSNACTVNSMGGAVESTAQHKWGLGSAYFSGGSGCGLNTTLPSAIGNDPFILETWFFPTSYTGDYHELIAFQSDTVNIVLKNDGTLDGYQDGGWRFANSTTVTLNAWNHAALIGDGAGNQKLFLGGAQVGATYAHDYHFTETYLTIGIHQSDVYYPFIGYIDETAITIGTDRGWFGGFTIPTQAYGNLQGTWKLRAL